MRPHVIDFLDRFLPHGISATIAPSWFTMVGLAGVVMLFVMMAVARRNKIDPSVIASAVLWCYVMAVAAGIVMPMMIDAVQQHVATGEVGLRWSGMTSFWGYLAGMGAVVIVCRDHGIPLARMGDLSTAPLGLALVFARVGCFLGGCDYGKVTSLPWAVRFPMGSPAWNDQVAAGLVPADRATSLPVHPTQLYEALLGLAIVVIAIVIARRGWRQGRVFLIGAAVYALGRIGIEALRGDAGRGIYAGLSSGQIFSLIVLVTIGLGMLATRKRALHALAAAAALLLVVDPHVAHAQVAPTSAEPAPAGAPMTPMAPTAVVAPPIAQPAPTPPRIELGLLFGLATPLNRRGDQVAPLAGPSISIGYSFGIASAWLDVDSYGNKDASHGTLLLSGGILQRSGQIVFGGRAGIGPTLVNFADPVFRDVMGTSVRFEALAEYDFDRSSWALWFRPLTIDVLSAADLGGPITTYQIRAGVAYRFGGHRAQPAYQPYPYGQPYGQPYGPPPYGPQPYPPQPQPNPYPPPQPQPQPQPQPAPAPRTP